MKSSVRSASHSLVAHRRTELLDTELLYFRSRLQRSQSDLSSLIIPDTVPEAAIRSFIGCVA